MISNAQYGSADGSVIIADVDGVLRRVLTEADTPELWTEAAGGIIGDYVAPEPVVTPPHLNNSGLVRFTGASPTTVNEAIRVLGVTRVAKGRYRALHETPMPSDQYSATASVMDPNPRLARVTARTTTFVEVRVTDLLGVAQDPAEVTIETQRVIYPS